MEIRFGSSTSAVDPTLGLSLSPRCFGEAQLRVVNPNAYQATIGQMGGEQGFAPIVQQIIAKHVGRAFGEMVGANGILAAMKATPTLIQKSTAAVDQELASAGVAVQFT